MQHISTYLSVGYAGYICFEQSVSQVSKYVLKYFLYLFRRSEFLGCLMIPVKVVMRKSIKGSFLLQPQMSLSNPSPIIPECDYTT